MEILKAYSAGPYSTTIHKYFFSYISKFTYVANILLFVHLLADSSSAYLCMHK